MFKKIFRAIYYVLLGGLTIIALLLVFSAFPIAGNYKTLMVLSGSMEPKIKTGSIVMVKGASTYKAGDVITFKGEGKTPTTHRIMEETEEGYVTRGDANNANDLKKLEPQNILGKVLLSIPYLGYLLAWVKTTPGLIIMIVIPAVIIIYSEALAIQKEIKKIIKQRREKKVLEPVKVSTATMPAPKTNPHTKGAHPKLFGVGVKKESVSPLLVKSSKAKTIKETAKKTLKASVIIFGFLSLLNLRQIQGTRAFFMDEEKSSAEMTAWVEEPSIKPGDIILNEVMWMGSRDNDGTGHTADEWIELKNTTDKDFPISKWRIYGAADSGGYLEIPDGCSIPANGYFLIANYNKDDSAINVDVDFKDTAMSLNNDYSNNGALVLKDKDGNVIDSTPTPTDANWPAGTNTTDKKQSMERDTKGQTWHTCDITSMTTTEVSTMQNYWDSNAQNYNCGTPKHDNLSLNDLSVINEPKQKANLQISDSTPTSTAGATSDLNPASNTIIGDSTPAAAENNIITDPGDSAPATDTLKGKEQEDIPPTLEPNKNQEDNDSAEDPGETEDISPPSSSDDPQADLAQEDPATDGTPSTANEEEDNNNTDSSLSPPENPEPEISSPETSIEETPSPPADSSPLENLNNS